MKIDLEDLERKARAATRDPRAHDEWERDNLVHQPQFALTLIERIRDLEKVGRRLMLYLELHKQAKPGWNGNRFDDEELARRVLGGENREDRS